MEDLGGARVQTEISGNAHFFAESEQECFEQIKKLVTFIPWNNRKKADPFPPKPPQARARHREDHPARHPTQALRRPGHHPGRVRRLRLLRGPGSTGRPTSSSASPASTGETVGIVGQPAAGAGRGAGRGLLRQGGPLHPLLRRLQHPAGHLRRPARATCPAWTRSTRASSATAPSSSTPTARPRSRRSPSSCARPTAAATSPCAPGTWAPTSSSPGRPPRSPSWARRARPTSSSRARSQAAADPERDAPAEGPGVHREVRQPLRRRGRRARRRGHRPRRDARLPHPRHRRSRPHKSETRPAKKHGIPPF